MVTSLELAHRTVAGSELPPLAFAHEAPLDLASVRPVENIAWVKPAGGLWLSPRRGPSASAWTEFLAGEWASRLYSSPVELQAVTVAEDARFLLIDSLDALREAVSAYLYFPTDGFGELSFFQNLLDFERLAQDFAGVYLTEEGQWATRRPGPGMPNLYGWDLESVLVFDPEVVRPA